MKNIKKPSCFDIAKTLSNDELRELLKEEHLMSMEEAPANFKQTKLMKSLFDAENHDYYTWSNKYSNVTLAIEVEILFRIRNDNF
jgi:hypothetical protein